VANIGKSRIDIIIAIIGSSLIVTLLTAGVSFFTKPHIDIRFWWDTSDKTNTTKFTNIFTNTGYSPVTHVRLTISYPGAKIISTKLEYNNENVTLPKNQTQSSVVYLYVPRLTAGGSIRVNTTIDTSKTGVSNFSQVSEFSFNLTTPPKQPYSVSATYDQGSDTYNTLALYDPRYSPFNPEIISVLLVPVLAYLSFAIIFRRRRKHSGKLFTKVLKDIIMVKILKQKNLPILLLDTNVNIDPHIFSNFEAYKRVKDFYSKLKWRESYILNNESPDDQILTEYNEECISYANNAYLSIKWMDYYKFDWVIGLPLIVLGSFFITFTCDSIPYFFLWSRNIDDYILLLLLSFNFRSIAAVFIIRKIVKISNDICIEGLSLRRKVKKDEDKTLHISYNFAFLISYAIMGISSFFVLDITSYFIPIEQYINNFLYLGAIVYASDVLRMIILAKVISRRYRKILSNVGIRGWATY
jgi:hypothetical protein